MATTHFDVLIIGAGISGLIAARQLINRGISNFAIIEARNRIGGRIYIVENDGDGVDLGAHCVLSSLNNAVYSFAAKQGLILSPDELPNGNCYISARTGQKIDEELGSRCEEKFDDLLEQCQTDSLFSSENNMNLSLADIFSIVRGRLLADPDLADLPTVIKEDMVAEFANVITSDLASSNPNELSVVGAAACQGSASMLKFGFSSLLPLTGDESVQHLVKFNTVVTKIVWSDAGCLLYCQPPNKPEPVTTLSANRVICTVPLGCLKAKTIEFVPPLPDAKISAINSLGFGVIDKYNLQFETKWWPENLSDLFIVWPSSDVGECDVAVRKCLDPSLYKSDNEMTWYRHIYAFDVEPSVCNGNYLVSYAAGTWAALVERLPDEEVHAVFCALICAFLQPHFPHVQMPFKLIRSKWLLDPFSRGSYTVMSIGSTSAMTEMLAEPLPSPENPRLLFAGESTHPRFFSTVHGAWESGEREADRIVGALELKASTSPKLSSDHLELVDY